MRSESLPILIVVAVLVAGSAWFLSQRQTGMLGKPGLKVDSMQIRNPAGNVVRTNGVALPRIVLNCVSDPLPVTDLELDWLPPDTIYGRRRYVSPDDFRIDMSVVLMGSDRTSIHKPEYCLPAQGIRIDQRKVVDIAIQKPHPYDLPVMRWNVTQMNPDGKSSGVRGIFIYWFVADGLLATDHLDRMWTMTKGLFQTGELQRWAFVTCFSACRSGDEELTFERMARFLAKSVPQFQTTTGTKKSVGVPDGMEEDSRNGHGPTPR